MELTFSLAELNKKSPYMLESSGSYSFSFIKKNRVGSMTEVRVWLRNLDDPLFEKNKIEVKRNEPGTIPSSLL